MNPSGADAGGPFGVFVSYAHADRDRVAPIVAALEEEGIRVWFDQGDDGILSGQSITGRLNPVLEQSRLVLSICSTTYPTRPWCQREYWRALRAPGNRLLPLDIDGSATSFLGRWCDIKLYAANLFAQEGPAALAKRAREMVDALENPIGPYVDDACWWPRRPGGTTFVGRFREKLELFHVLTTDIAGSDQGRETPKTVILSGLPGTGKSLLAREFALEAAGSFDHIVRLDAGGDKMRQLQLEPGEVEMQVLTSTSSQIRQWIRSRQPDIQLRDGVGEDAWRDIDAAVGGLLATLSRGVLWIVDDLPEGLSGEALGRLKCPARIGRTLFTSRTTEYDGLVRTWLHLDVFPDEEATELLRKTWAERLGGTDTTQLERLWEEDKAAIRQLAALVGNHPLALAVLAGRLRTAPPSEVLAKIETVSTIPALEAASTLVKQLPGGHETSIVLTFVTSLDQIAAAGHGREAIGLLRLANTLSRGWRLTRDLVEAVFQRVGIDDVFGFDDSIAELGMLSLVKTELDGAPRFHALVLDVFDWAVNGGRSASTPLLHTVDALPPGDAFRLAAAVRLEELKEGDLRANTREAASFWAEAWRLIEPIEAELLHDDLSLAIVALSGLARNTYRHMASMGSDERVQAVQAAHVSARLAASIAARCGVQDCPAGHPAEYWKCRALDVLLERNMIGLYLLDMPAEKAVADLQRIGATLSESRDARRTMPHTSEVDRLRADFNLAGTSLLLARAFGEFDVGQVRRYLDESLEAYLLVQQGRDNLPSEQSDPDEIAACIAGRASVDYFRAVLQPGLRLEERVELMRSASWLAAEAVALRGEAHAKDSYLEKDLGMLCKIATQRVALAEALSRPGLDPDDQDLQRRAREEAHERRQLLTFAIDLPRGVA